jgi:pyrroloquinoline-quinone synthase
MFSLLENPVLQMFEHTATATYETDLSDCRTMDAAVAKVAERYDFQWHPYFIWMRSASVDRSAFMRSQLPFRYAVESFSQSLAAVLARINTVEARMALVENINEEHGHGNPLRSHKATFRQYLQSLGATPSELESPKSVPVLAFNQSVLNYCLAQPPECSAAMLGMIEYLYVNISASIANNLHDRDWVEAGQQSHYAVHEILDVTHACDLLQIAQPVWNDSRSRLAINEGLLLGAHYFWTLYEGMYPNE